MRIFFFTEQSRFRLIKTGKKLLTGTGITILLITTASLTGCTGNDEPKFRIGSFFGSPTGITFADPNDLGEHSSDPQNRGNEKTGMLYTCKGGFIDLGHLREGVDRTAFLAQLTKQNLMKGQTEFTFKIMEPAVYRVKITLPENWEEKSEFNKAKIIHEASAYMGQYFGQTSMIWHEIITWYGYSSTGIFPEHISSFSWEDTYSDAIGTSLAVKALLNDSSNFDYTITNLIDKTIERLDVQPPQVAKKAVEQIKGQWFTGSMYFFVEMKKRNFDVGYDDGYITPMLVPGICPESSPLPWPAPDKEIIERYGMKLYLEIEPKSNERKQIYRDLYLPKGQKRLVPMIHFPMIIEQLIKKEQAWYENAGSQKVAQKHRQQNQN